MLVVRSAPVCVDFCGWGSKQYCQYCNLVIIAAPFLLIDQVDVDTIVSKLDRYEIHTYVWSSINLNVFNRLVSSQQ